MNFNRSFRRILCLALCICMLSATALTLVSCQTEDTPVEQPKNEPITAVRFVDNLDSGKKIASLNLQEVTVYQEDIPKGAITSIDEVVGKYLLTPVVIGDYVMPEKLSERRPSSNTVEENPNPDEGSTSDYINVAKQFNTTGEDIADKLQELIDKNPNKTLYFPDGTYKISKPITTPADPSKTVSLRLSNYAIIQPSETWTGGETPMIMLGVGKTTSNSTAVGSSSFITGGYIDCQGKTSAISVEGGRDTLIYNMSIKNAIVGIILKSRYTDVENVVVTGNGSKGNTIGVLIENSYNTVANMRIVGIHVGIKLTENASNNVMRNLHPLYVGSSSDSVGFWDLSEGNFYDYCYSDQFATGFRLCDGNASVLNGCFGFWYSKNGGKHWGIHAQGKFDSIVRGTRIDMCQPGDVDNAYIVVDDTTHSGQGMIIDALTNDSQDDHRADVQRYRVH